MEGGFFVTDSALPRSANCGDVFSRISCLLLKEIVDLRETLEFYELNCLQPKSAEPWPGRAQPRVRRRPNRARSAAEGASRKGR